jgi:hypothetical protein
MRWMYGSARQLSSILTILAMPALLMLPALAQVLLEKGILTPHEVKRIDQAASTPRLADECRARILLDKAVLSTRNDEQIAGQPGFRRNPARLQQTLNPSPSRGHEPRTHRLTFPSDTEPRPPSLPSANSSLDAPAP